jgi:hypothetical protein
MAAWAHSLGLDDAAAILEDILQEEKEADEHLTEIALRVLNPEALDEGEEEEDEEEEHEEEEEEPEPEPAPVRRRAPSRAKVKA